MEELNIGRDRPMNVPAIDIPWNNKDIVSKVLSDTYGSKSFAVYGIDLPPIARYLQTELPLIEATDRISDRLFELEDGSFAIVDYESEYKREKKAKYLTYISRVLVKYLPGRNDFRLRFIVIYTGDVKTAEAEFSTDCVTIRTEQAFLSRIDGERELKRIRGKLEDGFELTDEDQMMLVILPLTCKGEAGKRAMIDEVIGTAGCITARNVKDDTKSFILAAMCVASDKFITSEQLKRVGEMIEMTRLGRIFMEEVTKKAEQSKMIAVEEAVRKERETANAAIQKEREMANAAVQKEREKNKAIVLRMLARGDDELSVMEIAGISQEELDEILGRRSKETMPV